MLAPGFALWALLFGLLVPEALAVPLSLLDPSFAVGTGPDSGVSAICLLQDLRVLVGGSFKTINGQTNSYLARLNSNGSVDSSFTLQGVTDGEVETLLSLTNGNVLVGGSFRTILGASHSGLARLTADGTVDPGFDAGDRVDGTPYALAVQNDGRIWVGTSTAPGLSRILRLKADGEPDNSYLGTNDFPGFVFALLPLPDGRLLAGTNPQIFGSNLCVALLQADGRLDTNFDPGLDTSSVFSLVREPDGHVLVGGQLTRLGVPGSVPLLRMTADLHWDDSFMPNHFKGDSSVEAVVDSILLQPDGKIVAGGYFFEVGGYWRRGLVRLSSEGQVDACFDPGLGLGGVTPAGPVRALVRQDDGRILIGGIFDGIEGVNQQQNLGRLLPQSSCDSIRVYLGDAGGTPPSGHFFAAATFPPGGTNVLETSTNLLDWSELVRDTAPYLYLDSGASVQDLPRQFFRAHQER